LSFILSILVLIILFLAGCEEVSPYSFNCKNFNEEYLAKLSQNKDIDSARELASLYVECNPEGDKKYEGLALEWSEKVMSFKEAGENDLALYRALRNIDIDTGEPEISQ
jgi:hypothetical protein